MNSITRIKGYHIQISEIYFLVAISLKRSSSNKNENLLVQHQRRYIAWEAEILRVVTIFDLIEEKLLGQVANLPVPVAFETGTGSPLCILGTLFVQHPVAYAAATDTLVAAGAPVHIWATGVTSVKDSAFYLAITYIGKANVAHIPVSFDVNTTENEENLELDTH